jgi:hypothetical protein
MLKRIGIVATHRVEIRRNIKVRTPDGINLLTDLYLGNPAGAPAVIVRSPYGKNVFVAGIMAYPLASQGFIDTAHQELRNECGVAAVIARGLAIRDGSHDWVRCCRRRESGDLAESPIRSVTLREEVG